MKWFYVNSGMMGSKKILSSKHADSTNSSLSLSPSILIIRIELINVTFFLSAYTDVSMCRSPWENVTSKFNGLTDGRVNPRTTDILKVADFRICSNHHTTSSFNGFLLFSPRVSVNSSSVILTRLHLGRITVLFYQRNQIFIWSIIYH